MRKVSILLSLAFALLLPRAVLSQTLGEYTFATGTDADRWIPVSGSSLLSGAPVDGTASAVTDLGFVFPFGEDGYTQFSVNSDGNLRLGGVPTGTGNYSSPFSSSNANYNMPKINMLGCDGYLTDSGHVYYAHTVNADGDSVGVVEFFLATYNTTSRGSMLKWQVHLYHNGNIEVVYHNSTPSVRPAAARQPGMCVDAGDIWLIDVAHAATHYTAGASTTIASGNWPNAGRYYTFTRPVVTCPRPQHLVRSNLQPDGFTVSWIEAGNATAWAVRLGEGPAQTVTTPMYTFTGLTPDTDYTVSVASLCDDADSSRWNTLVVHTPCTAVSTLPYSYNFDNATASGANGQIDGCWGRHTNSTTAYPYPYSSQHHSGSYSLYFYNAANATTYSWATLPLFEAATNTLQVSFYLYKTSDNYGHVKVGVMDDPDDLSTFTAVADLQAQTVGEWEYYEVPLGSYTGTGRYLAFVANETTLNYTCLDDVTVDAMPSCPRVSALAVAAADTESVTLGWHENGTAGQWLVEWGPYGFAQGQGYTDVAYDTTYTIAGLSPSTDYTAYVTAICGGEDSSTVSFVNFATDCGRVNLPYSYGFESAMSGTSSPFPSCWTRLNDASGTNYYPYVNNAAANVYNGSKFLYFYQSTTATYANSQYAVLPPVNTTDFPMEGNELLFWAKVTGSTAAPYIIGVMTDPTDTSTFVAVDTVLINSSNYSLYMVNFSGYAGTGEYIAIRADRQASAIYSCVDDITVRRASSCPMVENAGISNVEPDQCTLVWNSNEQHSSYIVYYGTPGFDADTAQAEYVSDTTVTLFNLLPETEYEFFVEASCYSGDNSNATPRYTFHTACPAFPADNLPYVENFETYTSGTTNPISPCWTKYCNNSAANYPYPYASAACNGNIGLYFYGYRSSTLGASPVYSYATLPLFETEVSDLRVRFNLKRYTSTTSTYHSMIAVGVMDNPNDINTFEMVENIDLTSETPSSIHAEEVMFDQYTGTGRYIAFYCYAPTSTGSYNHIYLDDVVVDSIPSCRRSTNLVADNVTPTSADLSWSNTSDMVNGYTVAYSTSPDFDPNTCTTVATTAVPGVTLTGLSTYTNYYWAVRADCGADSSEWSHVAQFLTPMDCGPNSINVIDTIGFGTSATTSYTMYPSTTYPTAYSRNIFTVSELAEMGLQSNNRINSISIHCGSTGGTINDVSVYMVETDLDAFSSTPAQDTVAPSDMTLLYHGNITVTPQQWYEIVFDTAFTYSGSRNLMLCLARNGSCSAAATFYYTSTTPNYTSCYGFRSSSSVVNNTCTRTYSRTNVIFNVCTEIPACDRPTNVAVSSLLPTSADFVWHGTAPRYEVAYGPEGFDPDTVAALAGTHTMVNDTNVSLSGLMASTTYDLYVRSFCATDTSDWSVAYEFTTPCVAQALPYSENFETYGTGSTQPISPCWVKGTNSSTQYPYPYATNAINGSRSLYFYAYHSSSTTTSSYYCYAALPLMDAALDSLTLTFNMRRYSSTSANYTSRLVVGVMTDPSDISTFDAVDTIDLRDEPALSVHGVEVNFANYHGNGQYIALYDEVPPIVGSATAMYSYVYVDDIYIDYTPTCLAPVNVTVADSTIGTTTAMVSWTDRATAGLGYEVEYGPAGFALGTGMRMATGSNPVAISGLTPGSFYDVYVRAICSATDTGTWSFATTFATECAPLPSLPVTYDFESFATGTTAQFPLCWTRINDATGTTNYYPYVYNSTTYAHSGSNCLYFYAATTTTYAANMYAVLPEIDTTVYPANTLEVVFWGRGSTTASYDADIIVGMMSDPADAATFVAVDTVTMNASTTEYTVQFDQYTGHGSYVAFRKVRNTVSGYAYIDDITIEQISNCDRPYDLTATDATATDVTLAWTDTIGATSWVINYGRLDDTVSNSVSANSNPYTLTGLTPGTNYWFRVAAVCPSTANVGDYSRDMVNFATAQIPATVPYAYNFENAAEWGNWQTNSNQPINWYRGTAAAAEGSYGLYISADNGASRGTNMNQTVNACAYRDIQFDTAGGSYTLDFKANVGGTQAHNYDGLAVLLVDPTTFVEAATANITSPWGSVNDVAITTIRRTTGWQNCTVNFDNVSGVKRLVFYWFNQSTGTADFVGDPAAIDSIVIAAQPCQRPYDLNITALTPNSATLNWSGEAEDTYQVVYREYDQPASTNVTVTVTGLSYNLTGLNSNTQYVFWVRHQCDATLSSSYSDGRLFTTACGLFSASDTLYEDFHTTSGVGYNSADGELPACWEGYTNGTDAAYTPHVVNQGTYWYTASDSSCIIMTSGSTATYGNTKILRLPLFAEPVSTLQLSYWMCTESSSSGMLSVGYLTGDDYEHDFVSVKDIPASSTTMHSGTGLQPAGTGLFDTVLFENAPATAQYIAFRWSYNSTFYSVALDNIQVTANISCAAPQIVSTAVTYEDVNMTYAGSGESYDVAITDGNWSIDITPTATTTAQSYLFSGLTPATRYTVGVRQHCDSANTSLWSTMEIITDSMPCLAPDSLRVLSVDNANATFAWNANGIEDNWDLHLFNAFFDSIYSVNTNPATLGGLVAGNTYNAAIRARCGSAMMEGDWSDTLSFTTLSCPNVTDLVASNVTDNSVTIGWTADPMAQSWVIEYGFAGFTQGQGTTVTTTDNEYVVAGLAGETAYDFHVKAVCGTDWMSDNWTSVSAITLASTSDDAVLTLTVTGNGHILVNGEETTLYEGHLGDQVSLTAVADEGYHFTTWSDGNTDAERIYILTSASSTLAATFEQNQPEGIADVNGASCTIYPNPTNSSTTISVSGVNGKVRIAIVDMNGREVTSETIECASDCVKRMDVEGLAQGAYFVRITGESVSMVKKLIVR